MCIGASIIMGHVLFFLSIGIGWYFLIDYIETRYHRGYLLHRMYWLGLATWFIPSTKTVPDGMKREFIQ
jgi:conjugal transfer pilus assembly protein TraL